MIKNGKKFISALLAVVLITTVFPISTYAAETENSDDIQVSEVEESRDLYSKTYETSQGTNVVISTAVPMHYEEDGELKDIDNTLVESDADNSVLTNTANAYNVELPEKYTDDSEIKLNYEDNTISFKLLNDVNSSNGTVISNDETDVDKTDAESVAYAESNINSLTSGITYADVLPDTDVEYNVQPNSLKENIILSNVPDEDYAIQYELDTAGMAAVLNDDNSISVVDENSNEVFIIAAPYMVDANDNVSESINVSFEESENGYILTYSPDYTWLVDENTTYPVNIDPTVTIVSNKANQNIEDTFVTTTTKTKNKSTMTTVAVQNSSSQSWGYYNIKTLPELPDNAKITNCTLNLFTTTDVYDPYSLAMYALPEDAQVNDDYISKVNWNNKIEPTDVAIDLQITPENPNQIYFDITNLANKWYQNNDLNRILVLKALDGTLKTTIASSEYTIYANRTPYLSLEYNTVGGLDSNSQFHIQNAGIAGTAYVNDYTGNLVIERTDFSSNGSMGDLTFYMGKGVNTPEGSWLGDNVSVNYYKTLMVDSVNDDSEYVLTYGDGTKEYISDGDKYSIDDSVDNTIKLSYSAGGNYISETYSSSAVDSDNDKELNTKVFALVEQNTTKNADANPNANSSTVTVSYATDKIVSISDEIGTTTFNYSNGVLNGVDTLINDDYAEFVFDDCNGISEKYTEYKYEDNQLDIRLQENDSGLASKLVRYVFSETGNIKSIEKESESQDNSTEINTDKLYEYTYNDNDQVIKVQEYSTDSTAGEYLTFNYGANTTTISDGTNTYTEYFDLSGKLMSVIDQDGNAVFAQYNGDLISKVSATRNSARNIADFYGFESNKDSFFNTENGYVSISSDAKFNGNSSVKLTTPAQVNAVYTNKINGLEKNSTYTVSMWLNQPASANTSLTLTNGDSSGIFTTANAQNAEGWQQVYCTIDTEDSTYINVSVSVDNSTSSAETAIYIDNMYVQQSPYLTNVNLLNNSDFADSLNGWSTNANSSVVSEDAVISTADNNRLKITGDFSAENSISQTVSITASEGTKYTYGGWIKAVNAIPEKDGTNRKLGFSVYAVSADSSSQELLSENTYSTYYSDWQYLEDEITLPADFGHAGDTYSALKFVINYDYQMGYALFDGVSLAKDELFTAEFEYDEDGNMIALTTDETTVSVNDSNEDADHSLADTTYTYDDYGNITGITETATVDDVARDIVSKFEYGNSGSLLTKELTPLGRWTTYEYDYFANVARVTDANGNTVDYEYDNFNNLSGIISEFENKYIRYDDRDSQSPEVYTMKVQYTYSGDRLDKIETGNIEDEEFVPFNTYAFEYDNWGNLENIYINDMDDPYVHYVYDETDYRRINSIEYINGQEINYVYDDEGNIIYKYDTNNTDGDTLSYSYYYYDNGTCYGKKDNIAGTIESYQDGLTSVKDMDGNVIHVYGYDEDGNLLEQIGNNFVKIGKTSDDSTSQLSSTVNNSETVMSTEYDDFGRVISEKIQTEGASSYILREYTYYENEEEMDEAISSISNIITGNELEEIDTDVDSTDLVRYLTYYSVDENGNKEVIEEYRYLYYANGKTLSYTVSPVSGGDIFDVESIVLNACNEAGMAMGGAGTLFEYDKYGNIIKVYENSDELTPYMDFSYDSESNTALKNLLTGFTIRNTNNGDINFNISYDEFGNINKVEVEDLTGEMANGVGTISFSGVDLNWSRGSTLTNITGNIDISLTDLPLVSYPISVDLFDYKYDDNNLRTNKTINLSLDSIPTSILSALGISEEEATLAKADIDYIWRDGLLAGINVDCNGTLFDEGNVTHGNGGGKYSIVILYDENNNAYGLVVNKTEDADGNAVNETNTFYYMKDADNVITAIIDENGKELVSYGYDNNGAVMSLNNADGYRYLMLLNPLAYKDSVYDIESGLYYLESRYYEPYLGRFISPNSVLDTGSDSVMCTNLYSYCENDPVNNVDPSTGTNTVNSNIITNNAADMVLPFRQNDSDLSKFWNTENMLPQQKYGTYLW